jgi:hypothetical protein
MMVRSSVRFKKGLMKVVETPERGVVGLEVR